MSKAASVFTKTDNFTNFDGGTTSYNLARWWRSLKSQLCSCWWFHPELGWTHARPAPKTRNALTPKHAAVTFVSTARKSAKSRVRNSRTVIAWGTQNASMGSANVSRNCLVRTHRHCMKDSRGINLVAQMSIVLKMRIRNVATELVLQLRKDRKKCRLIQLSLPLWLSQGC